MDNNVTTESKIKTIIFDSIKKLDFKLKNNNEIDNSNLDSLDFVTLMMTIEEKVEEEFGKQINIIFDKSFLRISKLVCHIEILLND